MVVSRDVIFIESGNSEVQCTTEYIGEHSKQDYFPEEDKFSLGDISIESPAAQDTEKLDMSLENDIHPSVQNDSSAATSLRSSSVSKKPKRRWFTSLRVDLSFIADTASTSVGIPASYKGATFLLNIHFWMSVIKKEEKSIR